MFRFSLLLIACFLYIPLALGQSQPSKYLYYVLDGTCCGGEDSDPHAVFGIEASLKILELRLDEKHWPVIKPILLYLSYIRNDQYTGIEMDQTVVEFLRTI